MGANVSVLIVVNIPVTGSEMELRVSQFTRNSDPYESSRVCKEYVLVTLETVVFVNSFINEILITTPGA